MISASLLMSICSISVGGIIMRKILSKLGKSDQGDMVENVTVIMVATTMLGTFIKMHK